MHQQSKKYNIGIDCRLAGLKHAGIGRYTQNLVTHLLDSANIKNINWYLFFYDKEQAKDVLKKRFNSQNSDNSFSIIYVPIRHYSLDEQLNLPRKFNDQNLDLLHIPHFNVPIFYRKKTIVTIHDLLWHQQKGKKVTTLNSWKYWPKYFGYRFVASQAVRKASTIIVPANTVKNTLTSYYPNSKDKIVITKEGVSNFYKNSDKKNGKKTKKQFVYTGSLYPHKNIELVLKSLKNLTDYKLILVGSRNIFQNKVRAMVHKLNLDKQVKFAGYVSDPDLLSIYQESFALVQPSFSEGFGLPGIEAMASGLPVLSSDIPIFREIYKNAALYFDPYSVESFITAVKKLENSQRNRQVLIGKKISEQYDWKTMAEETLKSYFKLLV